MAQPTSIEWTEQSWNFLRGCRRVSEGCGSDRGGGCYAEAQAIRFAGPGGPYEGLVKSTPKGPRWTGEIKFIEDILLVPLKRKKPTTYFVNSMSDLFYEKVTDEMIDKAFAVMALCPQHTFQILTKRPDRMLKYLSDWRTPFRIAKAKDCIEVRLAMETTAPRIEPVPDFPNYYVSNTGKVFSGNGSSVCLHCGESVSGIASKKYCGKKCRQNANYHARMGREAQFAPQLAEMSGDVSEQGHTRAWLYRDGEEFKILVHRLVLSVFARTPADGEQGCHRDGDATNNHIANLRWGPQSDNWKDRKRHGNGHSWGEVKGTTPPIEWPIKNVWAGCSVEDQKTADERIPLLLQTPAALRWLSIEPLLGPVDLSPWLGDCECVDCHRRYITDMDELILPDDDNAKCPECNGEIVTWPTETKIDWVVVGGESGPRARQMHPDWARSLRDQCTAAGVPFFFKQWGEYGLLPGTKDGLHKCGKTKAGRLLDGREWNEVPE